MLPDPQETADLVAFTEEILNGKLNFLCSARTDVPLIIALAVTPVKECSEIGIILVGHWVCHSILILKTTLVLYDSRGMMVLSRLNL